jgi:hypothetical protein
MLLDTIFASCIKERLLCVMARAIWERFLEAQRLDTLYTRTAQQQYPHELLFFLMDVYEKAMSISRRLLGFVVLRELLVYNIGHHATFTSLSLSLNL